MKTHKLIRGHSKDCGGAHWMCVANWSPVAIATMAISKLKGTVPKYLGDSIGRRGNGHYWWELYVCACCDDAMAYVNTEAIRAVVSNTIEHHIGKGGRKR